MAKIKIEGLDKLENALKENVTMDDVKKVVRENGRQLQTKMQQNADFTKGYATGQTKRSILSPEGIEFKDNGFTVEVGPTTEYSPYLEYGTRFMDAQPFVKPAHNEQKKKFESDMQKLVR